MFGSDARILAKTCERHQNFSMLQRFHFSLALLLIFGPAHATRAAQPSTNSNVVRITGRSFQDNNGPFLGLGVSYFQALCKAKYDRPRLESDLALFASKGFNYIRVLSMVSWEGLEIAPISFTNKAGRPVVAWPDYWQQLRDLLDIAARHGLRVQLTIFADAQFIMPSIRTRSDYLQLILKNVAGREHSILFLEVANEAWQNGFPGKQGVSVLREFTAQLVERTRLPVAITSNHESGEAGLIALYKGSDADLATIHFSRDIRTLEGGWLPVRDSYWVGDILGMPPVISNEPIGPGSSVAEENDPMKLCSAAVFAWIANLPGYVYHSRAGITGYTKCCPPSGEEIRFENTPGISAYQHLRKILPPDLASWRRNDGLESAAPFTVFCDGQANKYWPDVKGAASGCDRNIGSIKGNRFISFPMGILEGGVTLQARRPVRVEVINPLNGMSVSNITLNADQQCTLPQGPGAYILRGDFAN